MKTIQALAASSTLLVASLVAHILAGGNSISLISAGVTMLMIATITWFLSRATGDPIRVTLAIFASQNFSHFILGGHAPSDSRMVASHFAMGLLSYNLIRYFDKTLPTLGDFFRAVFPPFFENPTHLFTTRSAHPNYAYRAPSSIFHSVVPSLRAPPSH